MSTSFIDVYDVIDDRLEPRGRDALADDLADGFVAHLPAVVPLPFIVELIDSVDAKRLKQ